METKERILNTMPEYDAETRSFHYSEPQYPRGTHYIRTYSQTEQNKMKNKTRTELDFIAAVKGQLRVKKAYCGLKYTDMADKRGISLQAVQAAMSPGNHSAPTILTLKYICDAMGITLKELFDNDDFNIPIEEEE